MANKKSKELLELLEKLTILNLELDVEWVKRNNLKLDYSNTQDIKNLMENHNANLKKKYANKAGSSSNLKKDQVSLNDIWNINKNIDTQSFELKNIKNQLENQEILLSKLKDEIIQIEIEISNERKKLSHDNTYLNKYKPQSIGIIELSHEEIMPIAKHDGYIPGSDFLKIIKKTEGVNSLNSFIKVEPRILYEYESEIFVKLTPNTYQFNLKEDKFEFEGEIQYQGIENYYNTRKVYEIKAHDERLNEIIKELYVSGEISKQLMLNQVSEDYKRWLKIKHKFENSPQHKEFKKYQLTESQKFITNTLPLYEEIYYLTDKESIFYEDFKQNLIKPVWLKIKVEYKKSNTDEIFSIKPCVRFCTGKNGSFKNLYATENFNYEKDQFRIYRCMDNIDLFHLTSDV